MKSWFLKIFHSLTDFVFPRRCVVCQHVLSETEQFVCNGCYVNLPFVPDFGKPGNPIEKLFWSYHIVRAGSMLVFQSGNATQQIVHTIKYHNHPDAGIFFGRIMAQRLEGEDFFNGIDAILPLPLSETRLRSRGCNQSEMLAQGISDVTGLPVLADAVKRVIDNPTQTHLSSIQRRDNVRDIFEVTHPEQLTGRHLLLVDDVITTGASLRSLLESLSQYPDIHCSILSLSVAGKHHAIPTKEE